MSDNIALYLAIAFSAWASGAVLLIVACVLYSILQEYRRDRVPVLLYHRLLSRQKGHWAQLTDQDRSYETYDTSFAEQMAYLHRQGFTSISLDDFLAYTEGRASLPPRPIMITFDDGFASNYHYAYPILARYGIKATIFVTPDTQSENFKKHASVDSPLSPEQMREMSEHGISIQSHGMTHTYLTELEPERISWELSESKNCLERILGKPVHYLAIPSGAYNRTVRKLTKQAGYKAVFCMLKGSNNKRSDRYALRRFVIGRDLTIEDFRRTLLPATGCYLRLASSLQNSLSLVLGPSGLDGLRNVVYSSRLGVVLVRGQLRYLVPGLTLLVLFTLLIGLSLALRNYF